jgi:hypothetical protein
LINISIDFKVTEEAIIKFKVTFEVRIDTNAAGARSSILMIKEDKAARLKRDTFTSCISEDNTSTLAIGISAIPGAIVESVVGIRCNYYSSSAKDIDELQKSVDELKLELDSLKDIDSTRYDSEISGIKDGQSDLLQDFELLEAKIKASDENNNLSDNIKEDIRRIEKLIRFQEIQNMIQQGKVQQLVQSQNKKIEEQANEVDDLKSLLLAERHQQTFEFKMLEKKMQEQLKIESIVLQAQLQSDVKKTVYEMQKDEMTSQMLQDLMNPESYYIRQMLRSPLDDKGEKLVTELIRNLNIRH